ncbi:hypothetical protein BsWGS_21261 [Bradybaena similaris]
MPLQLEYGILNNHPLFMLDQLLNLVYQPLLSYHQYQHLEDKKNTSSKSDVNRKISKSARHSVADIARRRTAESIDAGGIMSNIYAQSKISSATPSTTSAHLRDDFLVGLQKFMHETDKLLSELKGKLQLKIPMIRLTGKPNVDFRNSEAMNIIHDTIHTFQHQLDTLLETTINKPRVGDGPLVELKYWRERDSVLHSVAEQLNDPVIQYMLSLHMKTEGDFEFTRRDLLKYATEAKDNVRFLSTLERHFRNIKFGVTFQSATETIPPMMNALRMIWIISRHYNTDELMVPLMERIAWELCERVVRVIDLHSLFQLHTQTIKGITSQAAKMLHTWKNSYFAVRAKIESSGRDVRWEFDRKRLFDRSDYIAEVCQDVCDIAQVIEEFNNIFSQELKDVTGDAERIDDVLEQVYELVEPIALLPYDAFSPTRYVSWQALKSKFYKRVVEIEDSAKDFIDESFQSLRSSDGAFELLIKLRGIQSRESVNKRMQSKFRNIILQYNKEIDVINNLFLEQKLNPPVFRAYPPVAGSIYWERSLFHRIKASIIRFNSMEEMMSTDIGKMASQKYLSVAKSMRKFEESVFSKWFDSVEKSVPLLLRASILAVVATPTHDHVRVSDSYSSITLVLKDLLKGMESTSVTLSHMIPQYTVNLKPILQQIVNETRLLLSVKLIVPEVGRQLNVNHSKLNSYQTLLNDMLDAYYKMLNSLNNAEIILLEKRLHSLMKMFRAPLKRMNWYSLSIPDFVSKFTLNLNTFKSLSVSIHRSGERIEEILAELENTHLFKQRGYSLGHVASCKELFDYAFSQRELSSDSAAKSIESIGILITKIETTLATRDAKDKPAWQAPFYAYYERKIFRSITMMVIKNLRWFIYQLKQEKPFFTVESLLAPPDVILNPQTNDIFKTVVSSARDIVSKTKKFVRWLQGTCTEAPPQKVKFLDEPYVFSYFPDVANNLEVNELLTECEEVIFKILLNIQKCMSRWKRYRNLWRTDKEEQLEKWLEKPKTSIDFDYRFQYYHKCIIDISQQIHEKTIGCVFLSTQPLADAAIRNAKEWIQLLSEKLHAQAKTKLYAINDELMEKSWDLEDTIENLEELKSVLWTIQSIKDSLLMWEVRWKDIQEEYRTLVMYDYNVPEEQLQLQADLPFIYERLLLKAKIRDCRLQAVKTKFSAITEKQVLSFKEECEQFYNKFVEEGPGSVGEDLMRGNALMNEFTEAFDVLEEKRVDLALAEKLLELPITVHEKLLEVKKQLSGMSMIYALYREQSAATAKWSETLWVDLDIDVLNRGIDDYIKQLRKMPKNVRKLPAAVSLDNQMKQFKDALPLIVDLKSESLRERHWKELMVKTGQEFDMNPKTFTLAGIFSMKLYRFTTDIMEIVSAAVKEMSIEKGITEVEETWKKAKFIVNIYVKGNRKSHILGPVEEILQSLDDTGVNLQSMSASRFIGPFLPSVQNWEKALAKISEVLDVSSL